MSAKNVVIEKDDQEREATLPYAQNTDVTLKTEQNLPEATKINKDSPFKTQESNTGFKQQSTIAPELSNFAKIRTLVGCVLIHLVIGTIYIWGSVSPYISSFLKSRDKNITRQQITMIYPFMGFLMFLSTTFGISLSSKYSPFWVVLICKILLLLSVLCVSFVENLAGYIIIYMFIFGITSGMIYLIPIRIAWVYFPNRKGAVSGIILAAYGFGAFIFNFICKAIVNPDNKKPTIPYLEGSEIVKYYSADVYDNVPNMFRILFGCYTVLSTIGILLIKFPRFSTPLDPNKKHHHPNNHPHTHHLHNEEHDHTHGHFSHYMYHCPLPCFHIRGLSSANIVRKHEINECPDLQQGLQSYAFWSMYSLAVLMMFYGQFVVNQYKNYGITKDETNDDAFLTLIGSLSSVCNGVSRIFWAFLYDKVGFKPIFFTCAVMQIILTATMAISTTNKVFYGIWVCLSLFCMGCWFSTFPPQTSKLFGIKKGAAFYSFVVTGVGVANLVAFAVRQGQLEYENCYWVALAFSIVGFILVLFQKKSYSWWEQDDDEEGSSERDANEGQGTKSKTKI